MKFKQNWCYASSEINQKWRGWKSINQMKTLFFNAKCHHQWFVLHGCRMKLKTKKHCFNAPLAKCKKFWFKNSIQLENSRVFPTNPNFNSIFKCHLRRRRSKKEVKTWHNHYIWCYIYIITAAENLLKTFLFSLFFIGIKRSKQTIKTSANLKRITRWTTN